MPRRSALLGQPLFRLLAINLAIGVMIAALLLGGLLYLNPGHLRDLIFADDSPGTALGLLLFGFVVTFGSAAMGSAIMAMGTDLRGGGKGGKKLELPIELIPGAKAVPVRAEHGARAVRRHGSL
ncbi:hypothetical protein KQX62_06830 [Rhodopseudomonas palustris]|uniref:Uncharacterized protein n=1 Tax=Rhodopseudomonas palustris TaxID=1076 RepID=A0AAX3E279_RHOPL|nr:hypothetical protein [Rhodopseudomonas palustris]UYO41011.1 hypothetical protein KQX62_06830 [Rhodopseudomonas palustris]